MENYLDFMTCVLLTLIVLIVLGSCIWLAWNAFIEPIMDRIKKQKDYYWEKRYREERDEYVAFLKMMKIDRTMVHRIVPDSVETLTSHENCEDFESCAMIKFKVDLSEFYKM